MIADNVLGVQRRPRTRILVAAFLAGAMLLISSGIASAHGAFVRSEPAPNSVLSEPPGAVTIWFTEPIEPRLSMIDVLDASGRRVNTEEAALLPGDPKALTVKLPRLADGIYMVAWENFSAIDGHSFSGSFVFSVGVPLLAAPLPAPEQPLFPSPAEPVVRWLGFLSILAIVGCLVFELFISRPILTADSASENMRNMGLRMESRTLNFLWLAAGTFLAASIGELAIRASAAGGSPVVAVLQTGWGSLWLWRAGLLLGMIAVLLAATVVRRQRGLSGRRRWEMVALDFAAGILFTQSLSSHGAALTEVRAAAIFSDYLHLLAAGVWVGGIFYLALVLLPMMKARRQQRSGKRALGQRSEIFFLPAHASAIGRFSSLALLSVGILLITGLYSSWAQVTTFSALATPYGITLLLKLTILVPLLIMGAVNRFRVIPRLANDGSSLQSLRKILVAEAVLVLMILFAVGVLVSLEPARQTASRQAIDQPRRLILEETADRVNIKMIIEPGVIGPNVAAIFLTDRAGKPITNASSVTLRLTYLDKDIGTFIDEAVDHGDGIWVVHQAVFSIAGNWQAHLNIQRPGTFDTRASFRFSFPTVSESRVITPSARAGNLFWVLEVVAIGLLIGGVGLYERTRKTRARR